MAVVLDVNSVAVEGNIVELRGCDIDQLFLNNMDEATEVADTIIRFDLDKQGNRVFLYKVLKPLMKPEQSMQDAIFNLVHTVVRLSSNFIYKAED